MSISFLLIIVLAPLLGSLGAGLFSAYLGKKGAQGITILGVSLSCLVSLFVFYQVLQGASFNTSVYQWAHAGDLVFEIGFLIDTLSALMMCIVTFISLMVHIYSIGYMADDPGIARFFSYISLFTFAMLMLVMSNNFLQLFFGWEAVGLVSYLLIGFWHTRESAVFANFKAFLVNRVGDFGFLLGIGLLFAYAGSMNYTQVLAQGQQLSDQTLLTLFGTDWNLLTVTCLCLFIGAMGKSAQFPLHIWLPDSMEGPTPISALIHAATMVTAGIFMVARLSPLFEWSQTVLSVIVILGALTALFMGMVGMVQNDIKRVIAYSTLSQLGYMTVALGVSAYSAAIFHLVTHAFFKALLFLGAGSVIIALHHQQDMREMGGLRKAMPITWICMLIGALALIGTPFLSGFYSKDSIIELVALSSIPGANFAYFCVLAGVFITAFYTFRLIFLVFYGKARFNDNGHAPQESPKVVTIPLLLLAFFSLVIGAYLIGPLLFGDFFEKGVAFSKVIFIAPQHSAAIQHFSEHTGSWWEMGWQGWLSWPFALACAGIVVAWFCTVQTPQFFYQLKKQCAGLYACLYNAYYLDQFYQRFFAQGMRCGGQFLWKKIDQCLIDGLVNRVAYSVMWSARLMRRLQSGYLYHYIFTMIIAVFAILTYFIYFL